MRLNPDHLMNRIRHGVSFESLLECTLESCGCGNCEQSHSLPNHQHIPIRAREADESRHVCNARETPCRAPRARSQQTPGEASKRDPIKPLFKPIILNDEARREDCSESLFGSPIKQEDPLNLSILLSGGKETNKDSLSKGD